MLDIRRILTIALASGSVALLAIPGDAVSKTTHTQEAAQAPSAGQDAVGWGNKRPPRSGETTMPYSYTPRVIRVRHQPGQSMTNIQAAFQMNGRVQPRNKGEVTEFYRRAGLDRSYLVEVPAGQEKRYVQMLATRPDLIEFVGLDWQTPTYLAVHPNDPLYQSSQGNLAAMNMESAWDVTVSSSMIVIAFIDSGLRGTHEEFGGKQIAGRDFTVFPHQPIAAGAATDGCGHGTDVTGVAAAGTNNGAGIASTGFNTNIQVVKTFRDDCPRSALYTKADAIGWAATNGALLMNLSYTSYDPDADEASAIQTAWVSYGVPTINSAGNDNRDTSVYSPYPCSDLYVMCVGDADNQGNRWTTTDVEQVPVSNRRTLRQ